MEIDIIAYTPEQYEKLSEAQILEVQSAQMKKNRLSRALEEAKQKEKNRLIKNNIFLHDVFLTYHR